MSAAHQISAQGAFIADTLTQYVQAATGDCEFVSNERFAWNQASQNSQKPMVYVWYAGETPWSSSRMLEGVTHRVNRKWGVGVKRGRGFMAVRGDTYIRQTLIAPFTDVLEDIRNIILTMQGISEDAGTDEVSISEWRLGNDLMDGAKITFTTKNDRCWSVQTLESPAA
jgi:hypothetical protein